MRGLAATLQRIPIRPRITLVFAAALTILLATLGVFLHVRVEHQLDATIDQGLRSRAADLATRSTDEPDGAAQRILGDDDAVVAQVLRRDGSLAESASSRRALLTAAEVQSVGSSPRFFDRRIGLEHDRVRLLAVRATTSPDAAVLVVGQPLESRDEALAQLRTQLLTGIPIALLLACLAGYAALGASLRPVRQMSRQARAVEGDRAGVRLPVPPARDEIADLGETLNAMLGRLERALDHERAFVADASHELRTPLSIMHAEIDVALRTATDEGELREALARIGQQNEHVARLASDLLTLARADQDAMRMQTEPVDLTALVREAAQRFEVAASARGISVSTETDESLLAEGDDVRLAQLLDNLTANALRFALSEVTLTARLAGDDAVLQVGDDGPGFPSGFEHRAFDRFAVADEARGGGHTGLGLSIVQVIAEAHGGRAAITRGARGATVEVRIPALRLPDDD